MPHSAREERVGRVLRFAGFRRTVTDLGRAIDFYVEALGFDCDRSVIEEVAASDQEEQPAPAHRAVLRLGEEAIELHAPVGFERHAGDDGPVHGIESVGFQHIAIVTADMPASLRRLRRFSPTMISMGDPVRLPASSGGVTACKFRDPDGHPLELIEFPEGQGDPKWHRGGAQQATLGIDHSAIGVADVERSLGFYVTGLGFELATRQINRGLEQDRLDGARDVVVDVIGLQPADARTPHLELLGYRTPPPQSLPGFTVPADELADRLLWAVDNLEALSRRMHSIGHPRFAAQANGKLLLQDPDGHWMELHQQA